METMVMTMPSPIHSHPTGMSEPKLDFELSALLDTLSLQQKIRTTGQPAAASPGPAPPTVTVSDIQMNDDAGNSQSGTTASSNSSDARRSAAPSATATPPPCAFLDSLTRSYDLDAAGDDNSEVQVQTTCGEYLDLILIHRELFAARPKAHVGCSAAFTVLARSLELRAWRADRDADTEAIVAFRHEAWMVAAWMSSGGPWWRGGEKMAE